MGFEQRRQCDIVHEPSGLAQLPDGRIVVVDDEKSHPINILTLDDDLMLSTEPLRIEPLFSRSSGSESSDVLNDLEAVTIDNQGFVYAITSHSRAKSGKRSIAREQLVRFRVDGNGLAEVSVFVDLRNAMVRLDDQLKIAARVKDVKGAGGFNIEGLSFNKASGELVIGLRSPVVDDKAMIIVIKNPNTLFDNDETPNFADDPIYLALDKGGIRAIAFDPKLGGYLIISRQEKDGEEFKLWLWSGNASHAPRRVNVDGNYDLSKAEGIAPIRHNGIERIMIAFDVGQKSKRNKGCYLFLSYDQLELISILD
ncbi:MAG: DUF3616 domain-containing protein [Pseudomonadales bacterium]